MCSSDCFEVLDIGMIERAESVHGALGCSLRHLSLRLNNPKPANDLRLDAEKKTKKRK